MGTLSELATAEARNLDTLLGDRNLPTFQSAVLETLKRIRDPDSTPAQIADSVQCNPQLVVQLLRTVNSAAFGLKRPIEDAAHAASFLGRSKLETLVLTLAVGDCMPTHVETPAFESRRFWIASAQRATLGRALAAELCPAQASECFTIGLLHDMAVPILAWAHPHEYGPILEQWHDDPAVHLHELERAAFGICHAEVGQMLAEAWGLPESLSEAIGAHHGGPDSESSLPAVHLVSILRETEPEVAVEALIAEASSRYGLDPEWTIETVIDACSKAVELAELFD